MEIFYFFAGLSMIGLVAYGFQIWAIRSAMKANGKGPDTDKASLPSAQPGVSVLKPLKGLDDNLFDNIESICLQEYPAYEIIFSLQDYNDPAYKVARKVKDKYPEKDISIIIEQCNAGLNPKVNNLIPAYTAAKYEHILISDSNVMPEKGYITEIMKHMADPQVGLVSNLIKGVGGRSVGSILENIHLNSFIMGSVCFLDSFLKMPCVVGKSMLMRKKDLEEIGGFRAVKDVLAEDYIIGKRIQETGKKVVLSSHMIKNVNHYWGLRKFINRHTRWGKLRWKIGGIKYLSELLGNAVFMSFLPMILWELSARTMALAAFVSTMKIAGDVYVGRQIKTEMNRLLYVLSPIKDLVIGVIWFIPLLSNTVVWRGNKYIIGRDSTLSPCPETGLWSWRYRLVDTIKTRVA